MSEVKSRTGQYKNLTKAINTKPEQNMYHLLGYITEVTSNSNSKHSFI